MTSVRYHENYKCVFIMFIEAIIKYSMLFDFLLKLVILFFYLFIYFCSVNLPILQFTNTNTMMKKIMLHTSVTGFLKDYVSV